MIIRGKKVSLNQEFESKGSVIYREHQFSLFGVEPKSPVVWSGWVQKQDVKTWVDGSWQRAEIQAEKFNQRGRWYDVPRGEIIKAITLDTGSQIVLKVITRPAAGPATGKPAAKEEQVFNQFALTGKRLLITR